MFQRSSQSNWTLMNRQRGKSKGARDRKRLQRGRALFGFEYLEDRLLLAIAVSLNGSQVQFTGDSNGNDLRLGVAGGLLEYSVDQGTTFLQDLDTSLPGVQSLGITSSTVIDVSLGGGKNSLTIDSTLNAALVAASATLNDQGTGGHDTLIGPAVDSTWSITGANAGTLNTATHFAGVANLTGSAPNNDTFSLAPTGSLSGLITGGQGGADSLIIQARPYAAGTYNLTGPNAGTATLDTTTVSFSNIETIADASTMTGRTVTLKLPTASDHVHVVDAGGAQATIRSDNTPAATFPNVTIADAGLAALSLNPYGSAPPPTDPQNPPAVSGMATLAVDPLDPTFTASVSMNVPDQVTLLGVNSPGGLTVNAATSITAGPAIGDQKQLPHSDWTPGKTYANVGAASTTGSGTGMTVTIAVSASGLPTATLTNSARVTTARHRHVRYPGGVGTPISVQVTSSPCSSSSRLRPS